MYTLVARDINGQVVGQCPLGPNPTTIGRQPDCGVVLPSTAVSRRHASAYERDDGAVVIADEGSANGVQVDGHLIAGPTLVDHGNQIRISDFVLELVPQGQPLPAAPPPQTPPPPAVQVHQAPPPHAGHPSSPMHQPPMAGQGAPTAPVGATMPGAMAPAGGPPPAAQEDPDDEQARLNMTMLEPHAGAALAMALTPLQLRGKGGPYDGTVFPLDKPLITVGRGKDNELVLDDPSISRRHAQVRLGVAGQSFTLLDLRSSNGTFKDGERVKRMECQEGALVRFGDLVFKVEMRRAGEKAPRQMMTRKRVMILAGVVMALLVGVGVTAYVMRPKPQPPKIVTPEERLRLRKAETQKLVDDGKRRITLRQWTQAATVLDKALDKDPLNQEAQKLRQQSTLELENQATFDKAMEFYGLGNQENLQKAKEVFAKVDEQSTYARETRYKVKIIDERMAETYRIEGVSRCKARYWVECHKALCEFFKLLPTDHSVTGEGRLRNQLQGVEKRVRRKRDFVPCKAPRFLNPVQESESAADPDKVLAAKYDSPQVRAVLLLYIQGKVDMSIKKLHKLRKDKSMRPYEATLRELDRHLLIIRGKYQEGFSAFRERKADEAQKKWELVLSADSAMIPMPAEKDDAIVSFYRREITQALGGLYYDLGDEQFQLGRYRQAHEFWAKGKGTSPDHAKILNGLLQLEKAAEKLVRQGKEAAAGGNLTSAREKLTTARDISEEGRPVRKEAEDALKGM